MRALVVGLLMLLATPAAAIEVGSSVFEMAERTGAQPDLPLRVHVHRPAAWTPDRPVLLVMHGVGRDADRYLDEWRGPADRANLLVVCPEFSAEKYPGVRWYNLGNLMDREQGGAVQPPDARSFGVPDRVFDEVRRRTGAARASFALFGHSAGAQFVHRYLLFAERSAAAPIIVANSGWYTTPDLAVAFPYGLGGTGVTPAQIAPAFARPVIVLLGERDVDPNHRSLRRNAEADRQGLNRFERGRAFFAAANAAATAAGARFEWRIAVVPGVGHDNAGMARRAVELIVGR